ncbi:MAG: HAD-IA family hydrolase [Clostridia bacterium]|jgi:FMN phosphatase YigB (HAD superfamily)
MIKAVAFDLGNVLCRLDRDSCNAALAVHSPFSADEVGRLLWGGDLEHDSETGRADSQEYFRRIKDMIHGNQNWHYEEFCDEYMNALIPHPPGEQAVVRARELGLRVFVISNTSFLHSRFIFSREILATIPELYSFSYKVGVMKPHPDMWLWLLERSGLSAGECLYFDDVPAYCEAGAALGFQARVHDLARGNLVQELEYMVGSGSSTASSASAAR